MIYLFIFCWIIYSLIEGYREAYYWHHKMHSDDYTVNREKNLHPIFTVQRMVMMVVLLYAMSTTINIYGTLMILFGNILIFPFLHNGIMYLTRNNLSRIRYPNDESKWIYGKKWLAQSTTSTAVLTKYFTPLIRVVLLIVGVLIYLGTVIEYMLW
jgi:hypothetical protein